MQMWACHVRSPSRGQAQVTWGRAILKREIS